MATDTRPLTGGDIVAGFDPMVVAGALMFTNLIEAEKAGRRDIVGAFETEMENPDSPVGYALRSFVRSLHDARDLYGLSEAEIDRAVNVLVRELTAARERAVRSLGGTPTYFDPDDVDP